MRTALVILRSGEIWGCVRVLLDNVSALDIRTRHQHKALCGIVKHGFRVLDLRNGLCKTLLGHDGQHADLS